MTQSIETTLEFNIELFFSLTKSQRKILIFLLKMHESCSGKVFPSIAYICKKLNVGETTVKRLFRICRQFGDLIIDIKKRTYNGSETSHQFIINKNFLYALRWLDVYGHLKKPKTAIAKILALVKTEKNGPTPPQKWPPIKDTIKDKDTSPTPSTKEVQEVPIYHCLKECNIPLREKIYLSRFPEKILIEAKSDYDWYRKKQKVRNPVGLFISLVKENYRKYQKLSL